ncbi:MAG: 50S ribosomal protein L5 [Patescibacteria group bacterium]
MEKDKTKTNKTTSEVESRTRPASNGMKVKTTQEKISGAFIHMKGKFHYKNTMQAPKLSKVIVSVGTGSQIKKDKKRNDFIMERLSKITGQKASPRPAKKAVATFKTRLGDILGAMVTLRGTRMNLFLDKFLNVALPRTKDFKGVARTTVDEMGNVTIGIKEHSIFPETADEDLKDVFGLAITIVTTAKNKEEATAFLEYLGVPFKKA